MTIRDDGGWADIAIDAGWQSPDDIAEIKKMIADLDFEVQIGNRLHAQIILLQQHVGLLPEDDQLVVWAKYVLENVKTSTSGPAAAG